MKNIERMLKGKLYTPADEVIFNLAMKAHRLCQIYNKIPNTNFKRRQRIIKKLLPTAKDPNSVYLQGQIYFDYGCFTTVGKNFYANNGFTVLDTCPITIGDNVFFGPNCSLYTPLHPLRYQERNPFYFDKVKRVTDLEYGAPITIGDNCWFGGGVTVLPGVTIGEGCVIGAGSVVAKSIPAGYLAFGNPCKPIRKITAKDKMDFEAAMKDITF